MGSGVDVAYDDTLHRHPRLSCNFDIRATQRTVKHLGGCSNDRQEGCWPRCVIGLPEVWTDTRVWAVSTITWRRRCILMRRYLRIELIQKVQRTAGNVSCRCRIHDQGHRLSLSGIRTASRGHSSVVHAPKGVETQLDGIILVYFSGKPIDRTPRLEVDDSMAPRPSKNEVSTAAELSEAPWTGSSERK